MVGIGKYMNEKIIKPGIVKRVYDLLYKENQSYTQEAVNDVLTAFFDVIEAAVMNGDSIQLNGYMTIETQYRAAKKARNVKQNTEIIVPEHYKAIIKPGTKLNNAAKYYTEKHLTEWSRKEC